MARTGAGAKTVAVATLVALVALLLPACTVRGRRSSMPSVPRTGAYFGAWRGTGAGRPSNPSLNIGAIERAIGRTFAIDHQYYDWGTPLPSAYDRWTLSQGRIPMISVCACTFSTGTEVAWHAIAAGSYDRWLAKIARGFAAMAGPTFFSFDGEPESWVGIK